MPIPPLKHHIVLVSGQALPTLLGASLPGREPSAIHAVVTPAMRETARLLRTTLEARGRQCAFTEYPLEAPSSQDAIYAVLDSIRTACGEESLGINLTGGTKLMALAASEWAYACEVPAFYIDTVGEQAIQIGRAWRYASLPPDVLSVRSLLAANGFDVERADAAPVPEQRRNVLRRLLRFACSGRGERALGRLNRLAGDARKTDILCLRYDDRESAPLEELLSLCQEAGMAQLGNGYVNFPDEAARHWCNGAWFEEYVRMTLYRLRANGHIADWACAVSVCRDGVKNEIDALFTARNRLFTIECKTAAMSGSEVEQRDLVSSFLYKADSLHDYLGGVFARAMLCSVRPLTDADRKRAHSMDVRVVCGNAVQALEEELLTWSKGA